MAEGKDDGIRSRRVLELNPASEVFGALKAAQDAGDAEKVKLYTEILYASALLVAGLPVDDPTDLAKKISSLLK